MGRHVYAGRFSGLLTDYTSLLFMLGFAHHALDPYQPLSGDEAENEVQLEPAQVQHTAQQQALAQHAQQQQQHKEAGQSGLQETHQQQLVGPSGLAPEMQHGQQGEREEPPQQQQHQQELQGLVATPQQASVQQQLQDVHSSPSAGNPPPQQEQHQQELQMQAPGALGWSLLGAAPAVPGPSIPAPGPPSAERQQHGRQLQQAQRQLPGQPVAAPGALGVLGVRPVMSMVTTASQPHHYHQGGAGELVGWLCLVDL